MSMLTACNSEEDVNTEAAVSADAFSMQAVIDGYLISLPTEYGGLPGDRKSTRLNSSHSRKSRMPSSA